MNDLPGNDFNNIFKSLGFFREKLSSEVEGGVGPCYFTGVPGSFYGRIFPTKSLHFVHSSYSLQWLSQVYNNNNNNIPMSGSFLYTFFLMFLSKRELKEPSSGELRDVARHREVVERGGNSSEGGLVMF